MSRIGSKTIVIPKEVKVKLAENQVVVTGAKGELTQFLPSPKISIAVENDKIKVSRSDDERQTRAFHGLTRSLVANMVKGVSSGFEKRLELVGTGYRVKKEGKSLVISVGYSHPIEVVAPEDINVEVEGNNQIIIKGIDKQKVGQLAAEIRSFRSPEPYKGKGIRYQGEIVRRKAGKAAKTAASA